MNGEPQPKSWLKEAWYAAGLAEELESNAVLARVILNESVVMFRGKDGSGVAINNRCPHRFAPLDKGRLADGVLHCGYHGLAFDGTGKCVHNPHGPIGALAVRNYPLAERYGVLWIWMGRPDNADLDLLPEFDEFDPARFHVRGGYLHGLANYELMNDNILDLSHIEFLHPDLGTDKVSATKPVTRVDDAAIVTSRTMSGEILPKNIAAVYRTASRPVNRTLEVRWTAPSVHRLKVMIETSDDGDPWQTGSCSAHLFTPETERSTHYFYVTSIAHDKTDSEGHEAFSNALGRVFETEDKVMIDAQQRMIDASAPLPMPAMLAVDKAAVLGRRILADRILKETSVSGS